MNNKRPEAHRSRSHQPAIPAFIVHIAKPSGVGCRVPALRLCSYVPFGKQGLMLCPIVSTIRLVSVHGAEGLLSGLGTPSRGISNHDLVTGRKS